MTSRWLVLLITIISSQLSYGEETNYPYGVLSDCTTSQWTDGQDFWKELANENDTEVWFKSIGPEKDSVVREKALESASTWALNNGYLPCSFDMCGMVTETQSESIMVYLTSVDLQFIAPEVALAINPNTFKVHDSMRWHSGCGHRREINDKNS